MILTEGELKNLVGPATNGVLSKPLLPGPEGLFTSAAAVLAGCAAGAAVPATVVRIGRPSSQTASTGLSTVGPHCAGYDETSVGAVIMARPTKSPGLYTQVRQVPGLPWLRTLLLLFCSM